METNVIDVFHHNNVDAKIDKFRLLGHAREDILHDDIEALIVQNTEKSHYRYSYQHMTSTRPNSYVRLHTISYMEHYENGSHEEFTIAILVGFNGQDDCGTDEEKHRFAIEFNPQKFKCPGWLSYYFQKRGYIVEKIDTIDLAFDFRGFLKRDFRYALNNGNTVTTSTGTLTNKTDYIGKEKKNNRIKIYDKKKERAPYFEMEEETTRVEVTLSFCYKYCEKVVQGDDMKHILAACDAISQVFVPSRSVDDPFLYALTCLNQEQLNNALSRMTAPTKRKYKRLLKDTAECRLQCDATELVFFLQDNLTRLVRQNGFPHEQAWLNSHRGDDYGFVHAQGLLFED